MLPADQIKRRLRERFAEARERAFESSHWAIHHANVGQAQGLIQAWAEVFDQTFDEARVQIQEPTND